MKLKPVEGEASFAALRAATPNGPDTRQGSCRHGDPSDKIQVGVAVS